MQSMKSSFEQLDRAKRRCSLRGKPTHPRGSIGNSSCKCLLSEVQ